MSWGQVPWRWNGARATQSSTGLALLLVFAHPGLGATAEDSTPGGACARFEGCYAILDEDVQAVGTVGGFPNFGAEIQAVPDVSTAATCIDECRQQMFSFAMFQDGPVPASTEQDRTAVFLGLCACAAYTLNVVEVACVLGLDGGIDAVAADDNGKIQGWPGGVYHAYDLLLADAGCNPHYYAALQDGGVDSYNDGGITGDSTVNVAQPAVDDTTNRSTDTTATSGPKKNQRSDVYILLGSGAAAMLICMCFLKAIKNSFTSARSDQASSTSISDADGEYSGSAASDHHVDQRPGLADNPIFDAVVFLPSETGSSAITSGNGERASGAPGGAPPVAEAPPSFFCPITQDVMRDPVLIGDGHTYEREAIKHWLSGHSTSPMTNAPLDARQRNMVPNHTLRSMIVEFVEKFIADSHQLTEQAEPAAVDDEADDAGDGFINPLSDSAPPVDERVGDAVLGDAAPAGATFDVDNGNGRVGMGDGVATFDVEEAGSRRRGRSGLFASRGRNSGSRSSLAAADSIDGGPPRLVPSSASEPESPESQLDPGLRQLAAAPARLTGPYSTEEFDPDLYSREEMDIVQQLLTQCATTGGLTFRILAQYNVTCPRRMAEDRRRRAAFREQQLRTQAQRAPAAEADGVDAHLGDGTSS